jgi:hypothetical protein
MPKLLRFSPGGVDEMTLPGLYPIETHTSTCSHCQHITSFPSRRVMMEHVEICRGCMKLICLSCVGQPCRPYEREAERLENEEYLKMQISRSTWGCY